MSLVLALDIAGSPRTVSVVGGLDAHSTSEFCQIVLALYDVLGSDVLYDFRGIEERDEAAHATLVMLAHKFREFGRAVSLPELLGSMESRRAG